MAWLALGALVAATAQTEPAVRFEVTLYGTGAPGAGAPLSSLTDAKAGDSFDVKLRVLDQAGNLVPTYSKNVLLTIRAEFGQDTTVNVTGSDILAGGGETTLPISVAPSHAMTARTEIDPNGWPYEAGARISATDGSVITDNASGFFSINPARFAVTYTGSSNPLVSTQFTAGRSYLARVTAYNADNTVASGYRGTVQVGFTHTQTTTDEYIINGVSLIDRGAGYDADNPPLVTIVGDGTGATARASVIDLNGTNVVGAIGLGSAGSGYTVQPTITVEAPPDDGDPDTVESTAVAILSGYEVVRPVANLGLDNATSLVTDGGSGYDEFTPPAVTVVGGGGSGAIATATVSNSGAVTGITLDFSAATGYTSVPTLTIDPPADPAGTQATAEIVPVVAIEDTAGTASIVFGGIADLVPIIMPVAGNGYQLAADDGITFTADASEIFNTRQRGNGSVLTVSDVTIRSGGDDAGESTSLTYTLKNDTDEPDINVSGPIDVHFVLYEGNNQRIQWTERVNASLFSAPDNESIERLGTSFTIPENLVAGSYTLEVWPGYNRNNAGTVGINLGNPPDLAITQFNYAPGQYRGGDAVRFDLTYENQLNVGLTSALTTAFPHDGEYMIQIHLSTNSVYGDADDFLVWQESVAGNRTGTRMLPGQQLETTRYFKLPENLAGTYYLYARVNSAGGRDGTGLTPEFTSGLTIAGNNTIPPMESQKITILPKQASDTFRVSLTNAGTEAGGLSDNAAITRDGQYVVFESLASLAGTTAADINNIFLRNLDRSSTTLISVATGAAAANGHSANPEISADGRYVVFQSSASNLVAGDSNGLQDIFIRDTQLDITRRLSANPITGKQANAGSQLPSISADGRYVVFESAATNLSTVIAPSGITQIYLYDRDADGDGIYDELDSGARTLTVVTQISNTAGSSSSTQPRISADGNYVAFITRCKTFLSLSADSPYTQIVRWSRVTDQFKTVTVSLGSSGDLGDYDSAYPAINADGSYIAFASLAQNLEPVPGLYIYNIPHVFRASMDASGVVGEIKRMNSQSGSILDEPDNPLDSSIFAPDLGSYEPSISDDGQLVAFASESQNLLAPVPVKSVDRTTFTSLYVYNSTDTNYSADVYLYNLDSTLPAPTVERASVSRFGYEATIYTEAAFTSNLNRPVSRRPVISGNGRYVAFSSAAEGRSGLIFGATNYVNSDNNGVRDIYVYDRKAGLPAYSNLPQVSLLTPGITELSAGQTFTFVANASSSVRAISSVEFYANNSLIGTATTAATGNVNRFSFEWTAPSPGVGNTTALQYQISAIALDSNGLRSEISNFFGVTVSQVSGNAPSVTITSPVGVTTGTTTTPVIAPIGSSIPFFARVTPGSAAITSVKFYATSAATGANFLGTASALDGRVYGLNYVNALGQGSYVLSAVVSDAAGNIVQSIGATLNVTDAISGTAPTGSLVFPVAGDSFTTCDTIFMQALASDVDANVASVSFYMDGVVVSTDITAPFTAQVAAGDNVGQRKLLIVVTDTQGISYVSGTTTVSVAKSIAPLVGLLQPSLGASARVGSAIPLAATASDTDGTISSVGFYVDGALVANGVESGNSGLYTATWVPAAAKNGYRLTVKALDNCNIVTETIPLLVSVSGAVGSSPSVQVTAPASGGGTTPTAATAALGSQVFFVANATDDAAVTSVNFYADGILIGAATQQGTTNRWVLSKTLSGAPFSSKGVGSYAITAIASDADLNQTQSAVTTLAVTSGVAGTAPTGSLVFPAAASVQTLGQAVALQALASDVDGAIASVAFYANGVLVDTDTSAPFTGTWTPTVAGSYNLVLVITDAQGATTVTAPVTVTVNQSAAPSVSLVSPVVATTLTVGSNLALEATASDSDGTIASVGFYADGALVATGVQVGNTTTYTATWTPTLARSRAYKLTVKATDNVGLVTETSPGISVIVNVAAGSAPTVQVTAPASGGGTTPTAATATLGSQLLFAANATDNIAVTSVSFYADGVLLGAATQQGTTNRWALTKALNGAPFNAKGVGSYAITAIATDADGNQTQSGVQTLSVTPAVAGSAPTGSLIAPVAGSVQTLGQAVALQALADDADGAIASVAFYANGVLVDTDTTAPFTGTWTPTVAGSYNLVLVITDAQGASTVTAPVLVTVVKSTSAPIIVLSDPLPSSVQVNQPTEISATASAGFGSITGVVFSINGQQLPGSYDSNYGDYFVIYTPTVAGSYNITAVAKDSSGLTGSSNTVTLVVNSFVEPGTRPVVAITNPVAGGGTTPTAATAALGSQVLFAANASDNLLVTGVNFYADGVSIGAASRQGTTNQWVLNATLSGAPFSAKGVGSYAITAIASDADRNQTQSAVVTLNVTAAVAAAPVVTLAAPVPGTVVQGRSTLLAASATPASGATISAVAFYVNGVLVNTATTAPYSFSYPAPAVGSYKVVAVATDSAGNSSVSADQTFTVTANAAPVAILVGPQGTALLPFKVANNTTLTLQADATDADGSIASVEFYADGTLIGAQTQPTIANLKRYVQTWTPTQARVYTLSVRVTDNLGTTTTSAAQTVEVTSLTGSLAPTVTLQNPDVGDNFTSASKVRLAASAADPDGNLVQVEFYVNGALIGTASRASSLNPAAYPFSTEWSVGVTGIYTVVAVAQDTSNNRTMSAPVTVTATTGTSAPVVTLSAPAATATLGNTINFSATASDTGGVVTTVAFYVNGNPVSIDDTTPYAGSFTPTATGIYEITAVALDDSGNETVSTVSTVTVNPVAGTAPSIVLTSPVPAGTTGGNTPASLTVGQASTLNLIAQVTPGSAAIDNVKFYAVSAQNGATQIGSGTLVSAGSFLYQKSYASALTIGDYNLVAVVTDAAGNTVTSGNVGIKVVQTTTAAPVVTLAAPVPGTVVQGRSTLLAASATPASGATISAVAFYVNGVLVNTATTAPYSFSYPAPAVGSYKVVAVATDSAGNSSVSADQVFTLTANAGPVVSISAPVLTVELGSPLAISATATDTDGMDRVVFTEYLGTAINDAIKTTEDRLSPYGYQFNPTQTGQYIIRAEAFDDLGFSDTASLVVNVVRNTAKPTIDFIAPAVGATAVVGQATPVEVKVTVPTGATVNSIAFFANGVKIGDGFKQGTLDIYRLLVDANNTQLPWSPSVTGSLALTAEIVDSFGGRAETAAARQIQVVGQVGALPFVEIIQPVPPATTGGGTPASLSATTNSDLNLAASAVDSDGTVSSVEFFLDLGRAARPTATVTFPSVVVNGAALQQSTGYISSITFADGGIGYLSPPEVRIIGDGSGATAEAEILNGAISRIRVTNRGSGYTNAIVRLVGGGLVENLSIGFAVRDFSSDVWRLAAPFNFKSYGAGFYTFRAVAKDNNNNVQRSTAVSVTVSPAPLTTPVTGNVVSTPSTANVDGQRVPAGQTVQLALNPTVVGGTVASVEFFANGESVGVDTVAPYIVNWVPSYVGSYNVVAVVTDSAGNQGLSPAAPVYVGGNIAPTITLIRPAVAGTNGVVNQVVLLEAEASALTSGATVSTVEFNADGVSVGIASQVGTSNRYVLSTWRPASAKTYSITARVVDSFGQAVLTSARAITVQTQTGVIPTVSLTAPANTGAGGTTGGGLTISNNSALFLSAQANDADGSVGKVEFLMSRGQQAAAVATTTNGAVNAITVGAGGAGSGYLYAPQVKIVGNGVGAVAEAVVDNGSVTSIRLLSGGSGYTSVPQVVFEGGGLYENLVVGSAVNAPGTLTWSTSLDLRNFDVGPYFFRARATDNSGNTVLSPATAVTVSEATASAPVVTLSAPTPATIDLGLTSNLVAIATSAVGVNITKVDFYANGTLVSTAPLAPYLLAFTAPSAGSYEIYAIVTDSAGNATLSQARTLVVKGLAPDATLSRIDRAYQAILDRSSTSAETKSALARNGVNLTSGQVAELVLQSSDYRDNQAELILSHLAVWGSYPNSSDYADLQAKKLALTVATDAGLIDAVLASASYKQRYGDIADLSITNTTQYNKVRDFAVRIYTNLYGKAPAKAATTNTVAKQFFSTISTGGTAGQAVVNFINANFGTVTNTSAGTGITDGTVILATNLQLNATIVARLRVAGAILLIGNEQPTAARINAFTGLSLAAVADYYFEGDTPFAAGTMVSIETSTASVAGTTYYASGLPKGLTMDRTTGVISGRLPSAVKAYAITYWSQNKGVRSASTTRILMVDALEAKFIGSNEALLVDADGLPAGKLTVKVASTADYTGTLVYRDGATYSFKGVLSVVFDEDGVSTAFGEQAPIKRKAPLTTLDIGLFFDIDGALSTSVTEGDDVSPVASGDAIRVFNFTKAAPAPWQGSYKVGLLDVSDVPYFPDTAGSGTLSVANTGVLSVALVGKDGAKITGSVSGSLASDYRLYIRPYSKKPLGYFAGAIRFSDEATPSEVDFPMIGNDLAWLRPAGLAPITNGFGPLKIELDYAPPAL